MSLIRLFILAVLFIAPFQVDAAMFYADLGTFTASTTCSGNGTATTTPFCSINQFTNVARSAGDILVVRRNTATTTDILASTLTSDGTLNSPITVTADYDNRWNDNGAGFTTLGETATPVFGATTITVSASSTAIHNSWIYFGTDCTETYNSKMVNPCEFAYEVASSTQGSANTVLTLYLPYKGPSSGAGVAIRQMGKNPIVGSTGEGVQILTMSGDDYWYFKGLDFRSTNSSCALQPSVSRGTRFFHTVVQGDGTSACLANSLDNSVSFSNVRTFNVTNSFTLNRGGLNLVKDFLFDCNSAAGSTAINQSTGGLIGLFNGAFKNCVTDIGSSAAGSQPMLLVNVKNNNNHSSTGLASNNFYFEDNFSVVGLNSQTSNQISANALSTTTIATTTVTRSGGGPTTQFIMPPAGTGNTGISTKFFPYSYIKLFEYPIYTDTSSKTYTMYFSVASTSAFATDPFTDTQTASSTPEMFIECEYYNESSGADRCLKRSNTVDDVDFNGSTDWQDISVTCQPTQAGILYLRGWYAKPKEAGTNWFYMDTTPVIQ